MSIPTIVGVGTSDANAAAVIPTIPAGATTDDLLLCLVETANQAVPSMTSGWTKLGEPGVGSAGSTAATRLTVYWKIHDGSESDPTVGDSGNHQVAQIIAIRGVDTTTPLGTPVTGTSSSASTSGSIPGLTTTGTDSLVLAMIATDVPDTNGTAGYSGWSNGDLSSVTERMDVTTGSANGGGFGMASGEKASAGAVGTTSVTIASSAVKAYMSVEVFSPAASGQTISVGQASETDTATAVGHRKIRSIGQATETDTATTITRRKIRSVGQALETDTAQAITPTAITVVQVGQAVETNTAGEVRSSPILFRNGLDKDFDPWDAVELRIRTRAQAWQPNHEYAIPQGDSFNVVPMDGSPFDTGFRRRHATNGDGLYATVARSSDGKPYATNLKVVGTTSDVEPDVDDYDPSLYRDQRLIDGDIRWLGLPEVGGSYPWTYRGARANSTAYVANDLIVASGKVWLVVVAGTTASSPPAGLGTADYGGFVFDGGCGVIAQGKYEGAWQADHTYTGVALTSGRTAAFPIFVETTGAQLWMFDGVTGTWGASGDTEPAWGSAIDSQRFWIDGEILWSRGSDIFGQSDYLNGGRERWDVTGFAAKADGTQITVINEDTDFRDVVLADRLEKTEAIGGGTIQHIVGSDAESASPFDFGGVSKRIEAGQEATVKYDLASDVWTHTIVAVGQAVETDTATVVTPFSPGGGGGQTIAVGQAIETDTATAVGHAKIAHVAQASETDTATAVGHAKTAHIGQAQETDTAGSSTPRHIAAVGQAVETDSAQSVGHAKTAHVGQALETDTAGTTTPRHIAAVGQAIETDTAQAVAGAHLVPVGQALETDSALAVGHSRVAHIGQAVETDTAGAIDKLQGIVVVIGQALETSTAFQLGVAKIVHVGQAIEGGGVANSGPRQIRGRFGVY